MIRRQGYQGVLDIALAQFDPEAPPHGLVIDGGGVQPVEVVGVIADVGGGRFLVTVVLVDESTGPRNRSVA